MISSTQNEEISSGNDENEAEVDGSGSRNFGYDCEILAKIAKISQS